MDKLDFRHFFVVEDKINQNHDTESNSRDRIIRIQFHSIKALIWNRKGFDTCIAHIDGAKFREEKSSQLPFLPSKVYIFPEITPGIQLIHTGSA